MSTPVATATSIAARTAPGRSTTTGTGTRRTGRRRRHADSSIATAPHAPKARSARATPATIAEALAAPERTAAVECAPVAAPCAAAGCVGEDGKDYEASAPRTIRTDRITPVNELRAVVTSCARLVCRLDVCFVDRRSACVVDQKLLPGV